MRHWNLVTGENPNQHTVDLIFAHLKFTTTQFRVFDRGKGEILIVFAAMIE
jgi:hypothetical protein